MLPLGAVVLEPTIDAMGEREIWAFGRRRATRALTMVKPEEIRVNAALVAPRHVGDGQMTIQAFKRRFDELLTQLDEVEKTKGPPREGSSLPTVDENLLLGWHVKVINLLLQACGAGSVHYRAFQQVESTASFSSYLLMQPSHGGVPSCEGGLRGGLHEVDPQPRRRRTLR